MLCKVANALKIYRQGFKYVKNVVIPVSLASSTRIISCSSFFGDCNITLHIVLIITLKCSLWNIIITDACKLVLYVNDLHLKTQTVNNALYKSIGVKCRQLYTDCLFKCLVRT